MDLSVYKHAGLWPAWLTSQCWDITDIRTDSGMDSGTRWGHNTLLGITGITELMLSWSWSSQSNSKRFQSTDHPHEPSATSTTVTGPVGERLQASTEDAPVLDHPAPLRRLHDSGAGYKYSVSRLTYLSPRYYLSMDAMFPRWYYDVITSLQCG